MTYKTMENKHKNMLPPAIKADRNKEPISNDHFGNPKIIVLLFIVLRFLKIRFLESIMVIAGIALGVGVTSSVFSVVITFKKSLFKSVNIISMKEIKVEGKKYHYDHNAPAIKISNRSNRPVMFDDQDITAVKKECPDIQCGYANVPQIQYLGNNPFEEGTIKQENKMMRTKEVLCHFVTVDFFESQGLELQAGSFFSASDMVSRNSIIILGNELKKRLFKENMALGHSIKLNGKTFRVVGVLSDCSRNQKKNYSINNDAFLPLSTLNTYSSVIKYPEITYQVKEAKRVEAAIQQLDIFFSHRYGKGTVSVSSSIHWIKEQIRAVQPTLNLVSFFAVACLLIASINILNLMIARVIRQSKNIAILGAIGLSKVMVLRMFLLESLVLCLLGSIIGSAAAFGMASLVQHIINSQHIQNAPEIQVTWFILCVSIIITLSMNIIFGIYPAYQASRINAVEVLKSN